MGLLRHRGEDTGGHHRGPEAHLSPHSVAPRASFSGRVQKVDWEVTPLQSLSLVPDPQSPECHTAWETLLMGRWGARSQHSFKQNSVHSAQRQPGVGAGGEC